MAAWPSGWTDPAPRAQRPSAPIWRHIGVSGGVAAPICLHIGKRGKGRSGGEEEGDWVAGEEVGEGSVAGGWGAGEGVGPGTFG